MSDDSDLNVALEEPGDDKKKDRPKGKVKYDEDEPNLVPIFTKSEAGRLWLKKIVNRAIDDFNQDWESTEEYRKKNADDFMLFAGTMPKKTWPFKNCANAHLPLMLENLSRLQFRAAAELFGDWKQPFGVTKVGDSEEDQEIVDVLTVHGNWQIREGMPDFRRQVGDRGLLLYFFTGDVTCDSYYDPVTRRNVHEMLTCDDFVIPYMHVTVMPDYSDVPHRTKVMRRYRHELQAMRGIWHNIDKVLSKEPPDWESEPISELSEAVSSMHRIEPPTDQKHTPYKLLQYDGWLEMPPSEQEGDSKPRDRFVRVVVDYETHTPLSLTIHEEAPWHERERYERQMFELEQYRTARGQFEMAQQQAQAQMVELQGQVQAGLMAPEVAQQMAAQLQQQQQTLQPPPIPDWVTDEDLDETGDIALAMPMAPRKEPIHMFSHGVCIEPLKGNLGLSYGRIQAEYNRAADTLLSQFIDAATIANVKTIITDNVVQFEKDAELEPGAILKALGFTGNIDDHIKELSFAPANPQMFDLVRFMQEIGQSSIQAPNVLSGEPGKSGETYRGIATRIEQATKQLTVATQKYAQFVRQILKNNARLNAAFLPEEEMRFLMDYKIGELRHIKIERRLYERNYDVVFESDLRYAPQAQKIAEADEVTQMALDPKAGALAQNLAFQYAAIKKSLEARDRQDMVALLGAPPPVPPVYGAPSFPMVQQPPGPGQPGQQPGQGQQGGETPADGGGAQPPSPGVASGPRPQPDRPPGTGGPVMQA